MAVEQHLHRFLLEFCRVNATLGHVLHTDRPDVLLGCWIRVNVSSRSVQKSPYPSACSYSLSGTRVGEDRVEARSGSIPGS
jgi:hypothetical protein